MKNYDLYEHPKIETLKELLDKCVSMYREKIAFQYTKRKKQIDISYTNFRNDVNAFGSYLFNEGYKNCNIALLGENSYEWIVTHFAVTCGKNVIVPIDKDLDVISVAELLLDSESRVLVYSNTYFDVIEQLKKDLPNIVYINMKNITDYIKTGKQLIANDYKDFVHMQICKDDLASIVYTSGTTGKSKGVMLSHGNLSVDTYSSCCNVSVCGGSILLLPLHHTFALTAALLSEMMYGYPIYINNSLKNLQNDLKNSKPQNFFAVPLIVETFYNKIWVEAKKQGKDKSLNNLIKISNILLKCKIDLRKILFKSITSEFGGNLELIISGGASIEKKYIRGFEALGITVLNGYGITECGPVVAVNRNKFNIPGSVGLPLCCNEVKIADDGEVLVKGDNVMLGYYHNEAENKKVFADGWFKTGDIGSIDEYGTLHITGRIKNLIILGNGENISAESIEEQIYTIPYVKEAIAYGKDNMIVAEVFLDEEVPDAKKMIHSDIQKINQRLPQIKNIGKVIVRETEFPKTTTKKIKRNYMEAKND